MRYLIGFFMVWAYGSIAYGTVDCGRREPFSLVDVYHFNVKVEISKAQPEAVSSILEEINKAVPLVVGDYDMVSFVSTSGVQNFRPLKDSAGFQAGLKTLQSYETKEISFSIPRKTELRSAVLKAIAFAHNYEEPVVTITESVETRVTPEFKKGGACDTSPNKWWKKK